jgi:hypothetical protein
LHQNHLDEVVLKINLGPDRAHRIDDELLGVALMSVDLESFPSQTPLLVYAGNRQTIQCRTGAFGRDG